MPLLFETDAYMLTWPRVLIAADPSVQVELALTRILQPPAWLALKLVLRYIAR